MSTTYYLYGAVILALVARYVIRTIKHNRIKKEYGCEDPPAHNPPIFQVPFLALFKAKRSGDLAEFMDQAFAPGDKTFTTRVGFGNVLMTVDPENYKAILATQFEDFNIGLRYGQLSPLLGSSVFTLDGEGWKHTRAMLRPQFAREQVAHVKALEPHIQILAKHIRANKGRTFDIQELIFKLTIDTATEFLFDHSVNSLCDERIGMTQSNDVRAGAEFCNALSEAQRYTGSRAFAHSFYWLVDSKKFRENVGKVHEFANFYVNKALNLTPEELDKKSESGYYVIYEMAKNTRDPTLIRDQLLSILLAGRDTTASLTSFLFYELGRNPDIWEKLKAEIYENFGRGSPEDIESITFESLKKCDYLKWTINEGLRLYPTVPNNYRVAKKDTTLPRGGGKDGQSPIFVPKGTTVAFRVYTTHRLKEYYGEDALVFRPERWADLKKLGWAYIPFLGGPRTCLGQQFALTEIGYIFVRMAQMFPKLRLDDDGTYPPKKLINVIMQAFKGVPVQMDEE